MKKKNIIIGTGISIASIVSGYYLTRYGARKYIQYQENKIVTDTCEKQSHALGMQKINS